MPSNVSDNVQNLLINALYNDKIASVDLSGELQIVSASLLQSKSTEYDLNVRVAAFIEGLKFFLNAMGFSLTPSLLSWAVMKMPSNNAKGSVDDLQEQLEVILMIMHQIGLYLVEVDQINRQEVHFYQVRTNYLKTNKLRKGITNIEAALQSTEGQLLFALIDKFEMSIMAKLLDGLELDAKKTIQAIQLIMGKLVHFSANIIDLVVFEGIKENVRDLLAHLTKKAFDNEELSRATIELQHQIQESWSIIGNYSSSMEDALSQKLKHIELDKQKKAAQEQKVLVCMDPIPPTTDRQDKETLSRYEVLRTPMALTLQPQLEQIDMIEKSLKEEFPWAHLTVETITEELRGRAYAGSPYLLLSPKLLYGTAGCGKNRFARRLSEMLGQAFTSIALGGHGDIKSIAGTARGWASAKPSPIVELIMARQCANPMVLFDEIDKTRSYGFNDSPPIASILLQFLERENASNFMDTFLQARCNLSYVNYFATCNALETIPSPLLSRLQVLPMPSPKTEHYSLIFDNILRDEANHLGMPGDYFEHFDLLSDFDPQNCRSIRDIQRQVKKICSEWLKSARHKQRMH